MFDRELIEGLAALQGSFTKQKIVNKILEDLHDELMWINTYDSKYFDQLLGKLINLVKTHKLKGIVTTQFPLKISLNFKISQSSKQKLAHQSKQFKIKFLSKSKLQYKCDLINFPSAWFAQRNKTFIN